MLTALPAIIEKARHHSLQNALNHHLNITKEQKNRLEQIVQLLNKNNTKEQIHLNPEHVCKGMMGLTNEANEIFELGLQKEVTDAAIISLVQKMEHYEITSYGTAIAFANQLQMTKAEELLDETLNEEYEADDLLTALAAASLNREAVSEDIKLSRDKTKSDAGTSDNDSAEGSAQVHITERTINSPGGRAGTSHRRYGNGESRGH